VNERKARILQWPHGDSCPVRVGDRFELQSCVIEITRVRESLKAADEEGRPRSLWIAEFTRHEEERPQLLRFVPPTRQPSHKDENLDLSETERARRESAYTSTSHAASPHEPESVGADWVDEGAGQRELARQKERKARALEIRNKEAIESTAARLKQVGHTLGAKGRDLTPMLADIIERMDKEHKEVA